MNNTPRSERLHIGLFGRRNVGKSSLVNLLTGQSAALVSPVAGTTTDPVYKAMELLPLGPVVFIDTAGLDDEGVLGEQRISRTRQAMRRTDVALLVVSAQDVPGEFEEKIVRTNLDKGVPVIGVINKIDLREDIDTVREWFASMKIPCVSVSAATSQGKLQLLSEIISVCKDEEDGPSLVEGIIGPGETAVLVIPVDTGAPKGRIILPQVQTIRDILDRQGSSVVVSVEQLADVLNNFKERPKVVITDSQAFGAVSRIVPEDILLTSFSILFARYKGRLDQLVDGTKAIAGLKPGDEVLIVEGCTHHSQKDDIGRIKIPAWLNNIVGGQINYKYSVGWDFPDDLSKTKLAIHCGACMLNRREVLNRFNVLQMAGLPVVNYGVLIAFVHGIINRVLQPFPEISALLESTRRNLNDLSG